MKQPSIPNPTRPGALVPVQFTNPAGRRPAADITDRAKRYRAQAAIEQPDKRCIYCGKTPERPMVDHIDGREDNSAAENLAYACRSCNTKKGAHYAKNGMGRRTRQFNGRRQGGKGIRNLAQFIQAIQAVKGEGAQMELFEASELLKATPPAERSRWAREANARRWASRSAVPF